MALYLFNISVDSRDKGPDYLPEDLSINDQESIVEIIVEQVLGYENAIVEYDDPDGPSNNKKKSGKIDFNYCFPEIELKSFLHLKQLKPNFPENSGLLCLGHFSIEGPPPEC